MRTRSAARRAGARWRGGGGGGGAEVWGGMQGGRRVGASGMKGGRERSVGLKEDRSGHGRRVDQCDVAHPAARRGCCALGHDPPRHGKEIRGEFHIPARVRVRACGAGQAQRCVRLRSVLVSTEVAPRPARGRRRRFGKITQFRREHPRRASRAVCTCAVCAPRVCRGRRTEQATCARHALTGHLLLAAGVDELAHQVVPVLALGERHDAALDLHPGEVAAEEEAAAAAMPQQGRPMLTGAWWPAPSVQQQRFQEQNRQREREMSGP